MSLKKNAAKICGYCMYSSRRLESDEIEKMERGDHLVILRRYSKTLRDTKVFCRKEKIEVGLLDEACAFWIPYY